MRKLERIVIVREDKLGDSCLSLPVLEALRDVSPETRVKWVCQPLYVPLFEGHPNVEEVWGHDRKPTLIKQLTLARRIRAWKPDAILLLRPNNPRWRRVAWLSRTPIRVGCDYSGSSGTLTKNVFHPDWLDIHEARKTLDILSVALDMRVKDYDGQIVFTPSVTASAQRKIDSLSLPQEFIALQLGMGGSSQAFPPRFFATVCSAIYHEFGLEPVLTGSEEELGLGEEFRSHHRSPVRDLIGQTSFPELAELVSRAAFVLSVDTGITHVASGVGTPCVVLMPKLEVHPERWRPWVGMSIVVRPTEFCSVCTGGKCLPGEGTCVRSTPVDEVIEACRELLV
jgi:ADP-heptose:LPS heptosyltransferase